MSDRRSKQSTTRQWGDHLQEIFENAMQVAQALHQENELLWRRLEAAGAADAPVTPATDAEVARLQAEVDGLRAERDALRSELDALHSGMESVRRENLEFAEQFIDMERQNSNFISLYVASTQLHATLDPHAVLRAIAEIVINLIGAERFAVYLYDPASQELRCAVAEGLEPEAQQPIRDGRHPLFEIARSGTLFLADPEVADSTAPIAIQPLVAADTLVGVLVVYSLLLQKSGFEPIDLELFELLAGHAATAIMSSQLHHRTQQKAATLQGLIGLLKEAGTLPQPSPDSGSSKE